MIKINQKGVSVLISAMVYLLITIVIIALVSTSAVDLISKTKEQGNYTSMIDSLSKLQFAIEDVVNDKKDIELVIYNPGEIFVDCNNNKITGNIEYNEEHKSDQQLINNVVAYKSGDQILFEYNLDNYKRLTLDCNSIFLNNGKNILFINYLDYNDITDSILININRKTSGN